MNIGTNERDHPNSSPLQSPSPRTHSPLGGDLRQDSLDLKLTTSPYHSPVPSPQHHLDRPIDDRLHNRRPSDEASLILRKISGAGMPPQYNYLPVNHPDYKTHSLPPMSQMRYGPSESLSYQNFNDLVRLQQQQAMLGFGDPGRMQSALSDSYLNSIGQDFGAHAQGFDTFLDYANHRGILSPVDSLAPPLSNQDRHPSAPQLASILASSVDSKPDMIPMAEDVQSLPLRKRSWSMPSNPPVFQAPQINVCSPDYPLNQMNQAATSGMCKFFK